VTELGMFTITLLIFGPLLSGVLGFFLDRRLFSDVLSIALPIVLLALLAPLSGQVLTTGPLVISLGGHPVAMGINLYLDGLSLAMLWLSCLLALLVGAHAIAWMRAKTPGAGGDYRPLWLLLWSGLNALFLSGDLFNLYVTLEITTLAAVPLVLISLGRAALDAGMRYLVFALVGSILFLMGVALVYGGEGLLSMPLLAEVGPEGSAMVLALLLMTLGLAMKAALFPVHGWLPLAHSIAPSPASALLSAIVAKAAAYLVLRLWLGPMESVATAQLAQAMGVLGALGILYGSIQALRVNKLKAIIAYSTIAQLAYLLLVIPIALDASDSNAWNGVIYHALTHGLAKAALFLAAGNLILVLGNDRLESLAGCDRILSKNVLVIAIAGVAIAGLPPTGGFIAKWWMISAALSSGQWWWAIIIVLGGLLAAAYVFRILAHAFFTTGSERTQSVQNSRQVLNRALVWPPMILALLALGLGFSGNLLAPFLAVGYEGMSLSGEVLP